MWIVTIAKLILNKLNSVRKPSSDIPPEMLMIENKFRPGLSGGTLMANIIVRMMDAGIDVGKLPNGKDNEIVYFVRILVNELVKEIHLSGICQLVIPIGTITFASGECSGTNTNPVTVKGIIR